MRLRLALTLKKRLYTLVGSKLRTTRRKYLCNDSVRLKGDVGAATKIKFAQSRDPASIKELILDHLKQPRGARFLLFDDDGVGVDVTGDLPPGNYAVEII